MIEALNQTAESREDSRQGTFRFGHAVALLTRLAPLVGRRLLVSRAIAPPCCPTPGQGRTRDAVVVLTRSVRSVSDVRANPGGFDHRTMKLVPPSPQDGDKTAHMMYLDDLVFFTYALSLPRYRSPAR